MNTITSCIRFLRFMGALWLLPGAAVYGADSSTALAAEAVENKAPPHGFYLLNSRGLPIERIRFPSFIRGYSLRAKWSDLEPAPGVYDFSEITRALQTLQSQGKQLSLSLMVSRVPAHIIRDASGTFELRPGQTVPLPWDPPSQQAYGRMLQALSATLVPDRSRGGALVPLGEHPTLTMVNAPIIGLQGVRDLRGGVTRHPGYTRERFVESVLDCMEMSRQAFPGSMPLLPSFGLPIPGGIRLWMRCSIAPCGTGLDRGPVPSWVFFWNSGAITDPVRPLWENTCCGRKTTVSPVCRP